MKSLMQLSYSISGDKTCYPISSTLCGHGKWQRFHMKAHKQCTHMNSFCLLFHSRSLAQGFVFHVKYSADRSFIVGYWISRTFLPVLSGFIFQIRLSPTRTVAAAPSPFPLALLLPAASILNSLGGLRRSAKAADNI